MSTELVDVYCREKNWIYFGGGSYTTSYDKSPTHHWNYFQLAWPDHFKTQPNIPVEEACVCNTPIQQQCYVLNKVTKEVVVMGNCCIRKMELSGRTCSICNAIHRNRKDNLCNDCRIDEKKKQKIKENKQKGLCSCGRRKKYEWSNVCLTCYYKNK